jgi:nucleoid-associated protein YejK
LLIHREKLTPEHLTALTDCCPTQALTVCGEVKSVEEIMATVLRDKPFYDRSGGGLTINFDAMLLGERVFWDPATDTLTIKGTPPNLRDQLQRRTSGGN